MLPPLYALVAFNIPVKGIINSKNPDPKLAARLSGLSTNSNGLGLKSSGLLVVKSNFPSLTVTYKFGTPIFSNTCEKSSVTS